ncbi:MAG: hypothetical protein IT285_09720 [Bdellovibrionales bacterium]|nr:hypothetical protein [Bdellovibrionales bacterium]
MSKRSLSAIAAVAGILSLFSPSALAVFVNRDTMEFSARIEERVRFAVLNYLGDSSSRIVTFVNVKDFSQDRKIASSGDEVDLGYIPIPIDLRKLPKPVNDREVEIYGLDVEVILATPRQDIDPRKIGRLIRRLLKGMNPEVRVQVNTVENKTREYLDLERKIASIETRGLIVGQQLPESGGGPGPFVAIVLGALLIAGALYFALKSVQEAFRPGGGGGGAAAGMGGASAGGTMVMARGMTAAGETRPAIVADGSDGAGEAYSRIEGNMKSLKAVVRHSPEVFARVLGGDGRDWNGMNALIPAFAKEDRIALESAIDRHGLPLSKVRFDAQADDRMLRLKAPWLDSFVARLLEQNPRLEAAPEEDSPENPLVQEIDRVIGSVLEDYRPLKSSDYPDARADARLGA